MKTYYHLSSSTKESSAQLRLAASTALAAALAAALALALVPAPAAATDTNPDIFTPFCNPNISNYCKNHVACPTNKSRPCGFTTKMTKRIEGVVVNVHNHCRATATKGSIASGAGIGEPHMPKLMPLPSAQNMALMEWDRELHQIASYWVSSCAVQDAILEEEQMNFINDMEKLKKNFCFNSPRFKVDGWMWYNRSSVQTPLMKLWHERVWSLCANATASLPEEYLESYRAPGAGGRDFPAAGACLLWGRASRVGCAQRRVVGGAPGRSFVALACLYGPDPLTEGEPIYRRGASASDCPDPDIGADARLPQLCASGREVEDVLPVVLLIVGACIIGFIVFWAVEIV